MESAHRQERSISSVDVTLLRNAIRLIHAVQKERGSSCAFYADNRAFEHAMLEARRASDYSAALLVQKDLPIQSSLNKIRRLIDNNRNQKTSTDNLLLHRIFLCFNTLVSSVAHNCILSQISTNEGYKTTIKRRHKRDLSLDITSKLNLEHIMTPDTSDDILMEQAHSSTPRRRNLETLHSFGSDNSSGAPPLTIPTKVVNSPPDKKVQFNSEPPSKVQELLDLLHTFVQLKESAGIERAILSSQLALRFRDDPSLELLMNDLILQVEKQRSLLSLLAELPERSHRNLVLDLAQMNPQLLELQEIVLADFDVLKNAEYDAEKVWDLITTYVDKLHSVELLIIEELEWSTPTSIKRITSSGALAALLPQLNSNSGSTLQRPTVIPDARHSLEEIVQPTSGQSLMSQIDSMPAEELKSRVMEALRLEESPSSEPVPVADGSHHYSAAVSLSANMDSALLGRPLARASSKTEWDISIYEIKFSRRIGQGASATTYLATWSGQDVAVKVASITKFGLEGWRTEVATLQRLHHPNVIRLLGSIYHESPLTYCLVLEYCNAGDLGTALKYPTPRNFFFHVAISLANALTYLHSRNVIHRDLKPQNCLCDGNIAAGNFSVKITDFGVATDAEISTGRTSGTDDSKRNLTGETGTYRWMAPEVVRHESYSITADIYSFAIILWQLVTHEEPFTDVDSIDAAGLVAIGLKRPPIPEHTPSPVVDLIQTNWSDSPNDRWESARISGTLQDLQTKLSTEQIQFLQVPSGHPVYARGTSDVKKRDGVEIKPKLPAGKSAHRGSLLSNFFGGHKRTEKQKRK